MKIKVKDLKPNPYRQMDKYPIDRAKVEALKTSIKEKTFWDNLLVRKVGNKYQLAYGHHRWIALKELGIKEADLPVRDISDAVMLQIMAEENLNWNTTPEVINQTVESAKKFLDEKIKKYQVWEEMATANKSISSHFPQDPHKFGQIKSQGVGQTTILKFLGGNWKQWMIASALQIIAESKAGVISRKAVEALPSMHQARVFRDSVKANKIPTKTQKKIAKKITKEGVGSRDIPDLVAEHSTLPKVKQEPKSKPLPMLDDYIKETCRQISFLYSRLGNTKDNVSDIKSSRLKTSFLFNLKELGDRIKEIIK